MPAETLQQVLSIAVKNEHKEASELIFGILMQSIENDDIKLSHFLADKVQPEMISTALFQAVKSGETKALKYFLSKLKIMSMT